MLVGSRPLAAALAAVALFVVGLGPAPGVEAKDGAPHPAKLERARRKLTAALPPEPAHALTDEQARAQNEAARRAARGLELIDVEVRLTDRFGTGLRDVGVRGIQRGLDVSSGPAVTDSRGVATLRLPRGVWRLDMASTGGRRGKAVFARVERTVRTPGRVDVVLDDERVIRFRSRKGSVRAPHSVRLGWADLDFHQEVPEAGGRIDLLTTKDAPVLLQAVRRPDEHGGYVLRENVEGGTTVVHTDPEAGTTYTFEGEPSRRLSVRLRSADTFTYDLRFEATAARTVWLSGPSSCVVSMDVERRGKKYGFYALPLALDGEPRTFTGEPPFAVSAGYRHNTFRKYGKRRNTVTLRVFLRDANGLLVKGNRKGSTYKVAWQDMLRGEARAAGRMTKYFLARMPVTAKADLKELRYRLRVEGPGEHREVEVVPHPQTEEVRVGKVRVFAHPELAPNVRMWAACVNRGVRAYEETCTVRRSRVDVALFSEMPPGLGGWGGYKGNRGFMYLPEGHIFGFAGTYTWTGLLAHELGHVHNYWHGNATQKKVMRQAGRRAGRRLAAIRPGMARRPEGDRFRPLLEALTRGELRVDADFSDPDEVDGSRAGDEKRDGVLTPNDEATGEDDVLVWYLRGVYGAKADHDRRKHSPTWRWWLTAKGYTDDEIEAARLTHVARESLAWLARVRGLVANDHRIAAAAAEMRKPSGKLAWSKDRSRIAKRWRGREYAKVEDLRAARDQMLRELGSRSMRIDALVSIAAEHLRREEVDAAFARLVEALVEARRADADLLEQTTARAARVWATR